MLLLFALAFNVLGLLEDLNTLYENSRTQLQSHLIPQMYVDDYLGLGEVDKNIDDASMPGRHRQLQSTTKNSTNTTKTLNYTKVDEYYNQGPLYRQSCTFGQAILINVTRHYCYKILVEQQQYYDIIQDDPDNCTIKYRYAYGCLCPPDFYGAQCQYFNPIVCDIQQIQPTCQSTDKFYYNSDYDGDKPCTPISKTQNIIITSRTICYNKYQSILNRTTYSTEVNYTTVWSNYTKGIHGLQLGLFRFDKLDKNNELAYYNYTEISDELEKKLYNYTVEPLFFDTDILKSTLNFSISPTVTTIDWIQLGNSHSVISDYNLTYQQIIGNDIFQQDIQPGLVDSVQGRYSVELILILTVYTDQAIGVEQTGELDENGKLTPQIIYESYQFVASNSPKLNYYEDKLYVEPKSTYKIPTSRIVFIVILIILVIGLGGYLTIRYRRKLQELYLQVRIHPQSQQYQ